MPDGVVRRTIARSAHPMIDTAITPTPEVGAREPRARDEWSMRLLELGLAGMALAAALLLTIAR